MPGDRSVMGRKIHASRSWEPAGRARKQRPPPPRIRPPGFAPAPFLPIKTTKPRHSMSAGSAGKNPDRLIGLLREDDLRDLGLGAGSGVLVNDARLDGLIHR